MLERFSEVYRAELTADLLKTWKEALSDLTPKQLQLGAVQTLKAHQDFFPTPAQFRTYFEDAASHIRTQYREPVEKIRRRNVLDEVTDICREIFRKYDQLDPARDAVKIRKLAKKAAIIRYLRMGVEPTWVLEAEIKACRKYA